MKTKIISKALLTLALAFVLGNAITHAHGGTQASSLSLIGPPPPQFPVVTIQTVSASGFNGSTEDVTRGKIGVFVLSRKPENLLGTTFVNFAVSGTAIQGVDYTPLVSPAFIGHSPTGNDFITPSGFGVILVHTLPDPRASLVRQAQSVVVTLKPGPGYSLGQPSSAKIIIEP